MTATPGQAPDTPPALFARWWRIVYRAASDDLVTQAWRGLLGAEREFWTELAAQEPHAAPGLREALEATVSDWREGAEYRVTDTADEITEGLAVTRCADTLAGILADHPDTVPQPAPELAAAMAESRGYREALQVIAGYAAGTATKQMIGTKARRALAGKS